VKCDFRWKTAVLRFRTHLWGLRDNVRCSSWAHWKACSGLPVNDNYFSLGVTAEALWPNIDWNRRFLSNMSVWPKISRDEVAPSNHSSCQRTRMNNLSCGIRMWAEVSSILSQSKHLSDRRTDTGAEDIWLMAIPCIALHAVARYKNVLKYDSDKEILTEDIIRVLRTACFGAGSSLSMIGAM